MLRRCPMTTPMPFPAFPSNSAASNSAFGLRSRFAFKPALGVFCLAMALSLGTAAAKDAPPAVEAATQDEVAVEMTFLLANPGDRAHLVEYIERNWFAMDAIAAKQGLMGDYRVLHTGSDEGPWKVLVEVTYRDRCGYVGVREAFERIRAEHREVLVDGRRLRELGRIVDSKTVYTPRGDAAMMANP